MSHHMPWVDTLALNSLVILARVRLHRRGYACTEDGTKGCSPGIHERDKEIRPVRKREERRGRVLKFIQRTPALVNEDRNSYSDFDASVISPRRHPLHLFITLEHIENVPSLIIDSIVRVFSLVSVSKAS